MKYPEFHEQAKNAFKTLSSADFTLGDLEKHTSDSLKRRMLEITAVIRSLDNYFIASKELSDKEGESLILDSFTAEIVEGIATVMENLALNLAMMKIIFEQKKREESEFN